jgi:hypothetical protein
VTDLERLRRPTQLVSIVRNVFEVEIKVLCTTLKLTVLSILQLTDLMLSEKVTLGVNGGIWRKQRPEQIKCDFIMLRQ